LFIGQAKGYQHEAISTAMATLYNLGRSSGLWNTQLRTDCAAITKKPLKWEAKNLDAFDAIVFFTTATSIWTRHRRRTCSPSFATNGKGFIGIHSAAITFTGWPEVRSNARRIFRWSPVGTIQRAARRGRFKVPWNENFPTAFTLFDEIIRSKISPGRTSVFCSASTADKIDLSRKA